MAKLDVTVDRRKQGAGYVDACAAPNPTAGAGLRVWLQLPSRPSTSGSAS